MPGARTRRRRCRSGGDARDAALVGGQASRRRRPRRRPASRRASAMRARRPAVGGQRRELRIGVLLVGRVAEAAGGRALEVAAAAADREVAVVGRVSPRSARAARVLLDGLGRVAGHDRVGHRDRHERLGPDATSNRGPADAAAAGAALGAVARDRDVGERGRGEPSTAIAPPPLLKLSAPATFAEKVEFSTVSAPRQILIAPPRPTPSPPSARLPAKVLRATMSLDVERLEAGSKSIAPPVPRPPASLPSNVESVTTESRRRARPRAAAT